MGACEKKINPEVKEIPKEDVPVFDLKEIQEKGQIRALIDYSSTSYFLYKGQPMGYEYELLERFADHIGVQLRLIPIRDLDQVIDLLNSYQGDIIAANLTVTKGRSDQVAFTEHHTTSKQVLVQRAEKASLVENPMDLVGKTVSVRKQSSFYKRLKNLEEEIGGSIPIEEVPGNVMVEELIEMVSHGEIDYTIADQHVARINQAYYSNLHIKTPISFDQKIAWAVRKTSPKLLIALNEWLVDYRKTTEFKVIYNKYFANKSGSKRRIQNEYYAVKSGKISPYDDYIKSESERLGWDWRLLAAIIYQESQFDHYAESWAGASGLMQLMPSTAERFGLDSTSGPEDNIRAGVDYLLWLNQTFAEKVSDDSERIKFILAAYNVGVGHILDARRLARKYNKNPEIWDDHVAEMLRNKSKPKYYRDPVVKFGYCRGGEPFIYVRNVLQHYRHYQNILTEEAN